MPPAPLSQVLQLRRAGGYADGRRAHWPFLAAAGPSSGLPSFGEEGIWAPVACEPSAAAPPQAGPCH
eukprot:4711291-Lingulodinium_polyedra.AAC.1